MNKRYLLFIVILYAFVVSAEEYNFDASEFDKKPIEFFGTSEIRTSFILPEKNSLSWQLKYPNQSEQPRLLYNYLSIISPSLKITKNGFLLFVSTDGRYVYNATENSREFYSSMLEGYMKYEFNPKWNVLLGKKLHKWGKGYVYNPVSYASRQKDVNDIDALLEGYYTASIQYVKSFSSQVLKSVSQEFVFLPVYNELNNDYGESNTNWIFSHTYFLLFNTDYDLYLSFSDLSDYRIGFTTSHNLLTNWEVHSELSYLPKISKNIILDDGQIISQDEESIVQSIVGTRYLASFNSTFFIEYIYNGAGLSSDETDKWYSAVSDAVDSGNLQNINKIKLPWFSTMNRQFVMNHYFYFKIQHPEPFSILYFTPSLYLLYNMTDNSFLGGMDLNYKRFDNISFNLKVVGLSGSSQSEYGSKISKLKTELIAKYYF